ncbi:RNA recognition motif 2-domain-containing protein [Lyophyllum atratum]|nr:RNA recognition motif 2-domain-containing protein [Lyophyllum atratum]
MLKSFLKSFGGLRSFSSADDKVDVKQQPQVKTFRIDYYDVRCAVSAYSSIVGQIFFGMKLRVFGREDLSELTHARQQSREHLFIQSTAGAAFDASQNRVIFPTTLPGHPGEAALYFGPLALPEGYPATRQSRASIEPTDSMDGRGLEKLEQNPIVTPSFLVITIVITARLEQRERAMQPPQNVQFMPQLPPAPGFGYEYDTPYPQPMYAPPANMANLNFEHAMTMMPRSFVGETWFSEAPGMVDPSLQSVPYGGPQTPIVGGLSTPHISPNRQDTPLHFDPAAEAYQPMFRSTLPPSSPHTSRVAGATPGPLQGPSVSARESRATIEHNQLNIGRIEDGQDTRTTMMIKNIPNKMSDKDLIAYIGKVSSRKIDFLYLRMDFQNGCNVGDAFVNFITVQDLLFFAKRELGVRLLCAQYRTLL